MTVGKIDASDIGELLKSLLAANKVSCGEGGDDVAFFQHVKKSPDEYVPEMDYIVPKDTFHPKVFVTVDFLHTFVQTSKKLDGERIVVPEMLEAESRRLLNFVKYYFEYVESIQDQSGENQNVNAYTSGLNTYSEEAANEFINRTINFFVTSLQINRTRREIGTATITFKDTKNIRNGFGNRVLFDTAGSVMNQLFVPMLPVTVWARGRFYDNYYFPIYHGYIVAVSHKDTEGFAELEIMCKDVLELARVSSEMINPALIQLAEDRKINAVNLQAKPFYGHDHIEIIKSMFIGGRLQYDPSHKTRQDQIKRLLGKANDSRVDAVAQSITGSVIIGAAAVAAVLQKYNTKNKLNLMELEKFEYFNADYNREQYEHALDSRAIPKDKFSLKEVMRRSNHRDTRPKLLISGEKITPYRIWSIQSPKIFQSDFSSRLDVVKEVASTVYYDFYVDGAGNVHYHPFKLTNDYLINDTIYDSGTNQHKNIFPGVNVVGPEEATAVNPSVNFEELITFLRLTGTDPVLPIEAELGGILGAAIDRRFLQRFGYRRMNVSNPLFNYNFSLDPKDSTRKATGGLTFADLAAASLLRYHNAELFTKEATMIFRPELEVAQPVYFTDDKTVFYLNALTHSITIGGDATTTINCSFGRKSYEIPADLQSFVLLTQKVFDSPGAVKDIDLETVMAALPIKEWENYLRDESLAIFKNDYQAVTAVEGETPNSAEEQAKQDFWEEFTTKPQ